MFKFILTTLFITAIAIAIWFAAQTIVSTNDSGSGTDDTPQSPVVVPSKPILPTPQPGTSVTTPRPGTQQLVIERSGASSLVVNDFRNNGRTFEDPANPNHYILSGDLGYCLGDGVCPNNAISSAFMVSYSEMDDYFSIILLEKPFAEARAEVETFLQTTLGIEQNLLCTINYSMSIPYWISEPQAGKEIGFSFCPGSAPL